MSAPLLLSSVARPARFWRRRRPWQPASTDLCGVDLCGADAGRAGVAPSDAVTCTACRAREDVPVSVINNGEPSFRQCAACEAMEDAV